MIALMQLAFILLGEGSAGGHNAFLGNEMSIILVSFSLSIVARSYTVMLGAQFWHRREGIESFSLTPDSLFVDSFTDHHEKKAEGFYSHSLVWSFLCSILLKWLRQMKQGRDNANNARSSHHKALKDLESEMKLLQWHKLANESALQAALMRTKAIRKEEARVKPLMDKVRRMKNKERLRKAREEEEAKPIVEVSAQYQAFLNEKFSCIIITNLNLFFNTLPVGCILAYI